MSAVDAATVAPGPQRSALRTVLRLAGWAIVGVFIAQVVGGGFRKIGDAGLTFRPVPLVASTLLVLVGRGINVARWHVLLRGAGQRLALRTSARIFTTAELVRFLPGGALHLAARYRFARTAGIPHHTILAATALDVGLQVAGALALFAAVLPLWPGAHAVVWLLVPAAAVGLALAVRLSPIEWVLARLRLLKAPAGSIVVRRRAAAAALGLSLLGWSIRGIALVLVLASITPVGASLWLPAAGVAGVSWVAGIAAPIAPAGLGVREAAGASLLGRLVVLPAAVVAMLVVRMQSVVIELLTAWAASWWDRRHARRAARPEAA